MQGYLQTLIFVTIGIALLWFGYSLFFGHRWGIRRNRKERPQLQKTGSASPGDPQVCPICSSQLEKGDLVQTLAYPSLTQGKDRLMHIQGCVFCLSGEYERYCPVCGAPLSNSDILVARMFDRPHRRPHVHVLGCNQCRKLGIM